MSSTTFVNQITPIEASWLNDVNDITYGLPASTGSSLVGYTQAGSGAVSSTVQAKLRERRTIEVDGNCIGDGTAINTSKLQAILDDLSAGDDLIINGGNFVIDGPLTCAANDVRIRGVGDNTTYGCTIIASGDSDYTMLEFTGNEVVVEGVSFLANPSLLVAGANATRKCLSFTGDVSGNIDATVRKCSFAYALACIDTTGRNINIYDNLFSNSKYGVNIGTVATGQCRDFLIQRNRFHHMGDIAGSTFCIAIPSSSSAFEAIISDNFYDGQAYAMFLFGQCDELLVANNRISIPKYRWIDITGNIVRIADNVFEGNGSDATGFGISVAGSDVTVVDNTIINAPYQGIVLSNVDRYTVSNNLITNASNMSAGTYDAIQIDSTCTRGTVNDNHIVDTTLVTTRYGISGDATSSTAYGNTFSGMSSGNVNSNTLANTTPTAYGYQIEGANGSMKSSGAKFNQITGSASADVAYIDFDSDYGACIVNVNVSFYGNSGSQVYANASRYVAFTAGTPSISTIGTDTTNNCSIAFTYVGTSPNRVKVTVTNSTSDSLKGGVSIDLHGGGSNTSGRAGAILTLL